MQNAKIEIKQIILKIALFVAMLLSSIVSSISTFNLMATMNYGVDLSGLYTSMQFVFPIILALIYYGLYNVYINLMRGSLNSRMGQFNQIISTPSLRGIVDPCMIGLSIYVAVIQFIFLLFPLYENVLLTILKEVGAVATMFIIHRRLNKNLDALFSPIIYWSLQFSFAVLVVLV